MNRSSTQAINGLDVESLKQMISDVSHDPSQGKVEFRVNTCWEGGTRSETQVNTWMLAGEILPRDYSIAIDEPEELLGSDTAPNPQEMLMAAFNSCMLVGYVAGCTLKGIELEKLEIHTEGELDLRGFLGLDDSVRPGYHELRFTVRIKGNGSREEMEEIHRTVLATSPNRFNLVNPIRLDGKLVVEE